MNKSLQPPTAEMLMKQAQQSADAMPDTLSLRLHRALSWLKRAEIETDDRDVSFVLHWISFNAAYAREVDAESKTELTRLREYFASLVKLDLGLQIRNAVIEQYRDGILQILSNRYVYAPFWRHFNGEEGFADWATTFAKEKREIVFNLERGKTGAVLFTLFRRLYVLRNQMLHGAATWRGRVNREQVEHGEAILRTLVPIFIETMLKNPGHEWGEPRYPVVEPLDSFR